MSLNAGPLGTRQSERNSQGCLATDLGRDLAREQGDARLYAKLLKKQHLLVKTRT